MVPAWLLPALLLVPPASTMDETSSAGLIRLFTDPRLVDPTAAAAAGFATAVGPVTKDPHNPLLVEDRLWDVRWDNTYITSRYDNATGTFRLWYNGFASCSGYQQGRDQPGPGGACGHPTWHRQFGAQGFIPWPSKLGKPMSALMYAESTDGVTFTKYNKGIPYPWNGTNATNVSPTNILMMAEAASGTGILYDAHETNASRRYKALGSFWNYVSPDGGRCARPAHAVHGTKWPPCQCLGASFSADGLHWSGPLEDESQQNGRKGDLPGLDNIGQDDGALDLAIWDDDLDGGSYWGLVRVDTGSKNHRRTGRFVSKDFVTFSAAEQVFEGTGDDYQVYTVQPFRLPSWPKGLYLATAMFYEQDEKQGWVKCELLQTLNFGENWTRLTPDQQFIPLGTEPGAFDSHTLYTAWSGEQSPTINPHAGDGGNETLFYYAGGNGPHSGQRDDSIGLAMATTHAYAGLRKEVAAERPSSARLLTTGPIDDLLLLEPVGDAAAADGGLSLLADMAGGCVRVGVAGADDKDGGGDGDGTLFALDPAACTATPQPPGGGGGGRRREEAAGAGAAGASPRWVSLPNALQEKLREAAAAGAQAGAGTDMGGTTTTGTTRLVIEAVHPATLYALRMATDDGAAALPPGAGAEYNGGMLQNGTAFTMVTQTQRRLKMGDGHEDGSATVAAACTPIMGANNIAGDVAAPGDSNCLTVGSQCVFFLGQFDSVEACTAACTANSTAGDPCRSWTWHGLNFSASSWRRGCYGRHDMHWKPSMVAKDVLSAVSCKYPPPPPPPYHPGPYPAVKFSWDTVPVFFHSDNMSGSFSEESLRIIARYPIVTIEKYMGPSGGAEMGPGKSAPVCCEEDRMLAALATVKAHNKNASTIMYFNTVLDFPQYRLHAELLKNPSFSLKQDSGEPVLMGGDGHDRSDMLVYDFTVPGMCELFISNCLNATTGGMVDGFFLDRSIDFGTFPNVSAKRVEQQHVAHASCFVKLQTAVGYGPVISNHAYNESRTNAAQIEACDGVDCIHWLQVAAANSKLVEHHVGASANSYEPCLNSTIFITQLALFLLGAGHQAYFTCGPWHSSLLSLEGEAWKNTIGRLGRQWRMRCCRMECTVGTLRPGRKRCTMFPAAWARSSGGTITMTTSHRHSSQMTTLLMMHLTSSGRRRCIRWRLRWVQTLIHYTKRSKPAGQTTIWPQTRPV